MSLISLFLFVLGTNAHYTIYGYTQAAACSIGVGEVTGDLITLTEKSASPSNIWSYLTNTAEDCACMCTALKHTAEYIPACKGFDWNPTASNTGVCFVAAGYLPETNPDELSGPACAEDACGKCKSNYGYSGGSNPDRCDVHQSGNSFTVELIGTEKYDANGHGYIMDSPEACRCLCATYTGYEDEFGPCVAFSFDNTGRCRLYDAVTSTNDDASFASGQICDRDEVLKKCFCKDCQVKPYADDTSYNTEREPLYSGNNQADGYPSKASYIKGNEYYASNGQGSYATHRNKYYVP